MGRRHRHYYTGKGGARSGGTAKTSLKKASARAVVTFTELRVADPPVATTAHVAITQVALTVPPKPSARAAITFVELRIG